jgi:4-hydroxybenzoate polyprenyltransferase
MSSPRNALPLCVDLDGTLVLADLSSESIFKALRAEPWILFLLPVWLFRGKSYLKAKLSAIAAIDASTLPYDSRVIDLVRQARSESRMTVLVTGSHQRYADQVGAHLQIFDEVIGTDRDTNLTGVTKAKLLQERFGSSGFEYVANETIDLEVWRVAAASITVNASRKVVSEVRKLGRPHLDIPRSRASIKVWLKAIRIHQWSKNALLFVPIVMAHQVTNWSLLVSVAVGFLAFGLCASSAYILNDLIDLEADRIHQQKRKRPFAAGILSVKAGVGSAVVLLLSGIGLAMSLPVAFQFTLAAYVATTLLYSLRLKAVTSLDVLLLAGLYTLRVIAGAYAAGLALSFWLLAFSMFIFLSLALVKRVAELVELRERHRGVEHSRAHGREYSVQDIPILQTLGASSGYLGVLVLALYINSSEVLKLYRSPEILWLIAPLLLLWVTRLWIVTTRGYMNEDPIFFAIKDPETWITAAFTGLILLGATLFAV